ncbi:hypothetical protein EN828_17185 [Mesorhizobium sp. M2D.F.Ca.ET.185.01.1.1]|uniref:hypothetical protein n=1 Tax=unclassified Mesorhizobium TaxID=325217 RepID=UPI000FCAC7CA|nr:MULTISPECIES: hypothetical protein [unclassified Mesorhizobium]TGP50519.1 hypothetical protein EN873_25550 [bacterium M00.F.Ca.ET.230.01.1.1]TGP79185.1 hypothetical protein EN870_13505 [bacterium M00.F.Ca.ET.227.01.1.1]TGQ01077.1 hypothetical protein EN864_03735 [bacterium M00.F.Ca.ET.221.01.1.1]TGQ02405.1 hypothetical protein EN865_00170 [bacterium M00.F.Ca.ET.222.01.1.1]TGU12302.1 hypothetical protein EN806_17940 [bacterium M00.F.Ca.ET.163.01.1.1]TGU34271.1 hypothetical protein EN799_200
MGELIMSAPVAGLTSKNKISAEDVAMLRREVFADGVVSRGEAEALFALDQSARDKCGEWAPFFVEAVTDYIVHQERPEGYISQENAGWLVRTISRDGMVDSRTELELLVHVLEEAKSSPNELSAYALEQVAHAVIDGRGPLMLGGELVPGLIARAEVDLLRRILYAYGGDGNIAISKAEAEVLFRINDRTAAADNDPSWNDLFVKAIANYVMCSAGYEPPTREAALRHEDFLDEAAPTLGGFFSRMVSGGFSAILEAYNSPDNIEAEWEARNRASEALARRAETIDADEAQWLAERVGGGQRPLRDNERALLTLIKHASPEIHPALKPLLDKVA